MIYFFGFIMSLLAFFTVCLIGLITGQPLLQVLIKACVAAIIFMFAGILIGAATGKLLRQIVEGKHKPDETPKQPEEKQK